MSKVLVDTCIWSEVLRRKAPNPVIGENLAKLLRGLRAVLIGPVRQEILSGISDDEKFIKLKNITGHIPLRCDATLPLVETQKGAKRDSIK